MGVILLFILLVTAVNASVFENNETNVGVFVNHLSSCNLNHDTNNMLCINQDYNTVIQYHDVAQVTMCQYHYCILFKGNLEYSCTGYILTLIGGKMDKHLNPLTPNSSLVGFSGDPGDDHVSVGYVFLGYNILIDFFEQNVDNDVSKPIDTISCMEPYSTHVLYKDGSEEIFGAYGIIFRSIFESLVLGVLIHGTIAFILYIFALSFCRCANSTTVVNLFLIPLITLISCFLILFVAEDFVVKIFPFTISSVIGVILGYIIASIVFNSILYCKGNKRNNNIDIEENTQFVIDGDGDDESENENENETTDNSSITEIELGKVTKP